MKWKAAKAGHGGVNVGKNYENGPLRVEKKVYQNGIGTHADSTIAYDLPAGAERFQAQVAIDDGGMERAGKASDAKVRFYVYAEAPAALPAPNAGRQWCRWICLLRQKDSKLLSGPLPRCFNPTNIDFDAQETLCR